MPCKFNRLRKSPQLPKTRHRRKFDISAGKLPYSQNPRNFCIGGHGLAAPFVRLPSKSSLATNTPQDVFIRGGTKRYLSQLNKRE
jgi:hypothetical protein